MNANELADYLDNNVEAMIMSEQTHIDQAATMLRQQQEQINNLKQWEKRQLDVIETQQAEIEELKTCLIVEQEHNERIEAILRKAQEKWRLLKECTTLYLVQQVHWIWLKTN